MLNTFNNIVTHCVPILLKENSKHPIRFEGFNEIHALNNMKYFILDGNGDKPFIVQGRHFSPKEVIKIVTKIQWLFFKQLCEFGD